MKILNFNLWHGLNHTQPNLMLPAETWSQKRSREQYVIKELKRLIDEGPLFACFQEVNPVREKTLFYEKNLGLSGACAEGNVGLRAGSLSYPVLLQEGLATFWTPDFAVSQQYPPQRYVLSGPCREFKIPFLNIPVSLQLAERRIALIVTGEFRGHKIAVINTHLHHGNPKWKQSGDRRLAEISSIFSQAQPILAELDFVFLTGDFNCYQGLPEYQFIIDSGFEELSLDKNGNSIVTWDPAGNNQCLSSVNLSKDPVAREWDEKQNAFDHLFLKKISKKSQSLNFKSTTQRIFDKSDEDGTWASDHYGLLTEIQF